MKYSAHAVVAALLMTGCGENFGTALTTSSGSGGGDAGGGSSTGETGGSTSSGDGGAGTGASSSSSTGPGGGCGDTMTSPDNCGACGHSCLGAACVDGGCQPTQIATDTASSITVNDVAVVWGVYGGANNARAADLDGSNVRIVPTGVWLPAVAVASNAGHVTVALNDFQSSSYVMVFDASGANLLASPSANSPVALVMDGARAYWASNQNGEGIYALDLGTYQVTQLAQTIGAEALAVDATRVYWTEAFGYVQRASLTGENQTGTPVLSGLGDPCRLALGGGELYWVACAGNATGTISSAHDDGTGQVFIASASQKAVATDATHAYWIDHELVKKRPLAGGPPVTLGPIQPGGPMRVQGLAVSAERVYWAGAGVWWVAK